MTGSIKLDAEMREKAAGSRFPGWEFLNQPHVAGHVTWEWTVPDHLVNFSREWRHIMLDPDDPTLETTVASWWPRVHEDDVVPFLEAARDIVEGVTEDYRALFRVQRRDGNWAWLLSRGRVTEKRDGKPYRVSGALMDVSALRTDVKFQHGRRAMAGQHAMLDNSPDLIVRMDRELFPLYVNPQLSRYMARAGEGCVPRLDADGPSLMPERLDFIRENVRKVFDEGAAVREVVSFATDYGHDVTGEYSFWPEYDTGGKIVAVMAQFRDLTDQVLAERRAKLNEARLDALYRLSQMDDAPEEDVLRFVADAVTRLTASESGYLFFPEALPDLRGRVVWSPCHYDKFPRDMLPEDALPPDLRPLQEDAEDWPARGLIRNGNCLQPLQEAFAGMVKVLRYLYVPVVDGGRVVMVVVVANKGTEYKDADLQQLEAFGRAAWFILRRRRHVEELRQAKIAAEKASRIKDEFLANVSHELRTPLNGMLSMLKLVDVASLSGEQRKFLRTASTSGETLLRIISDILDFSRMGSGKMCLRNEPFDFRAAVASSLEMFRPEAARKGLELAAAIDEAIPGSLLGDGERVRQILFNLVGNAVKFTEKGGVFVEASLLARRADKSVAVYISVRDTGIGIPANMLNQIFQAFTQIDSSSTKKYPGTGLGLTIVKHLVDLMGGGVSLESERGAGTAVHVSVWFAPSGETSVACPAEEAAEPDIDGPLDILVAEDDAVARLAMRAFLERNGHRPFCVANGREALEALKLSSFHCLFTDIQMPGMDGLEVAQRIRAGDDRGVTPGPLTREKLRRQFPEAEDKYLDLPRDIVIVAVSAHAMSGDRERFLASGMDFYLSKPVIMKELQSVLRKIGRKLKE